ncbi:MAG TPA: glucoamylase family protein [Balneolales bacterium]|nr:glucoamylase family protein [Balneolales bacterium]
MTQTDTSILYNPEYLAEKARQLSQGRELVTSTGPLQELRPILEKSTHTLTDVYRILAASAKQEEEISPAGEWIIDNFYIIQEQLQLIKEDFPTAYYRKLPRIKSGPFRKFPRVYEIMHELATLTDNVLDRQNVELFVRAYQEREPLLLGELWAIPIMLRFILVQRLEMRARQILENREIRREANKWVDKIANTRPEEPTNTLNILADMAMQHSPLNPAFLVTVAMKLQTSGILREPERIWFDWQFRAWQTTLEVETRNEAQRQTQLQVSVRNAVISLREASEVEWSTFVENSSVVERILRLDPSGIYPNMDFKTRDRYRKIVEHLSQRSKFTEFEIAKQALLLAEESVNRQKEPEIKTKHLGYYLIDAGLVSMEKSIGYKPKWREHLRRFAYNHNRIYLFPVFFITACLMLGALLITWLLEPSDLLLIIVGITSLFPALDLAIAFTNRLVTILFPPHILPKMGFEAGIPKESKTLVVIPTLLTSSDDARKQVDALEARALANPDPNLFFALLSDFTDAPDQHMPEDKDILAAATEAIDLLNHQHNEGREIRFFLLQRDRQWNEQQGVWMGWERKRGKLEELNKLLRNPDADTSFSTIVGDFSKTIANDAIKYVITLDADTQLPPGSANDLARTAAHPLNEPVFDEKEGRVVEGYGVFQPKIAIPPESASQTIFAGIFSGNVGLDPYTTAVSDAYQDLFWEGIYTGKGLYNVDVFRKALEQKFPENTVLSHDLLEGNYIRAALVTDIELYDDYPTTYKTYSKRQHRWVRGDWQLLYWLMPKVPAGGGWRKNHISHLGRWKVFDNLRRSITPFSILIFLLLGWTIYPGASLFWTIAAVFIFAFPIYNDFITAIFRKSPRATWKIYFEKILSDLKANSMQAVMSFVMLAHQAILQVGAVVLTIWRMFLTKKNLLEWTSAYHTELETGNNLLSYIVYMRSSVIWGIIALALTDLTHPVALVFVFPIAGSWIAAPFIAWYISQAAKYEKEELTAEEKEKLRVYARRTWLFFHKFVGPDHSWLPPDNVQEEPAGEPAPRTSPTNIGLALLSTQSAYDFGYLTRDEFLFRLGEMLGSLRLLERYRGHYYNWYNTKIGAILNPRYISTVDSGNLVASLITLKQALLEVGPKLWPNPSFFEGLRDSVNMLEETLQLLGEHIIISGLIKEIRDMLEEIELLIPQKAPGKISDWVTVLINLRPVSKSLADVSLAPIRSNLGDKVLEEVECCFDQIYHQVVSQLEEINKIFPIEKDRVHIPDTMDHMQSLNALRNQLLTEQNDSSSTNGIWKKSVENINEWITTSVRLANWCSEIINEMDFSFLYKKDRNLFSIGYNVDRAELDDSVYDLLASEARVASFISIAKGEVPPKHWFRMSRRLTVVRRNEILLSWGGTMFEYLMPLIFMRLYRGTLLSETYQNVVNWQKTYGVRNDQPWGYSESAFYLLNLDFNYQYRAFGVPGLGLRRGLAEEYVVAPYASMLSLMVDLQSSIQNLDYIKKEGGYGPLGFYEAIDYTKNRIPPDQNSGIVKTYMAHHQGMSLLSLTNVLLSNIMQERFHSDTLVQSCELLLQERIPKGIPVTKFHPIEIDLEPSEQHAVHYAVEHIDEMRLNDPVPRVHMLSNGHFNTVITNAGTGFTSYDNYRLTRWHADRTTDADGTFLYVRDLDTDEYWSIGRQPAWRKPDRYDVWFHSGKVQLARVDNWLETFMEICVSPEDDIELRRYTLTNYKDTPRRLDITSFSEIVLNDDNADKSHPAFSKLFVQTEYLPEQHAILARRRPRAEDEETMWMVHVMAAIDFENLPEPIEYETDRDRFIGRGHSLNKPRALEMNSHLSGTTGNVLDPIMSMRRVIELDPGEKIQITLGIGVAKTREAAVSLADRFDNPYSVDRVFELSKVYGLIELENLNITIERSLYFQKMAGALLYGDPSLRGSENDLVRNKLQQSSLWAYGISGDLPMIILHIKKFEELKVVRTLLKAHQFWRMKGLKVDFLILNDHPPSYADELQNGILQAIQASPDRQYLNQKGGVFVRRSEGMPEQDLSLMHTVASIVMYGKLPNLSLHEVDEEKEEKKGKQKIIRKAHGPGHVFSDKERKLVNQDPPHKSNKIIDELTFFNGFGGFDMEKNEYVILVNPADRESGFPPMPWINVIANEHFGFIVTEKGSGYTWSRNSRENRLTSWSNDPVLDPTGEAIFVRDDDAGIFWSPTPEPVLLKEEYEVRHGLGYTSFKVSAHQLEQQVLQYVPREDSIKIIKVSLTNLNDQARTYSLFRYNEWVQGVLRNEMSRYVICKYDEDTTSVLATNYYNHEFAGRVAFASVISGKSDHQQSFTCDRTEFIGRNSNLDDPMALKQYKPLSGNTKASIDPCSAFKLTFKLEKDESADFYFLLGEADDEEEAKKLVSKYQDIDRIKSTFDDVTSFWKKTLGKIQISTPEPAIDIMTNSWLQYQNLACRIWARSAFYQSGGAFGYRDQLQDVMSLIYMLPELTRNQILLHAAHQFPEGDVLHWWHPPTNRGIRTRFSDDLLWLPYVTAFYLKRTGDRNVLDEEIPFVQARSLEEGEEEAYLHPGVSQEQVTLFEHCCRAIDRSLTKGVHKLPLMGTGDWNDGMNKVGHNGKGESVWLGFFLYDILDDFIPECSDRGDTKRAERYRKYQKELKDALNKEGWDGDWYKRAYYDDGTPLGSKENDECKIDSIAQSWSVLSGAGEKEKTIKAMNSVEEHLVSGQDGLIKLLTPPFNKTVKNPGYIKGYIPGVRENGGQYTHAALWVVYAMAMLGKGDRAGSLMSMLSPVSHTKIKEQVMSFKVEPYSVPADIYSVAPHIGRGGWTWYTGSAGWMYRIIVESLLGFQILEGEKIIMDPCIPKEWDKFMIQYNEYGNDTIYTIDVRNPEHVEKGVKSAMIDGHKAGLDDGKGIIPLKQDGKEHKIVITMG